MYKHTSDELAEQRLLRYRILTQDVEPYLRWQLSLIESHIGNRILEVGCGIGGFTELLGPRELILSLDVEQEVLDYSRERLADRDYCHFELLDITQSDQSELARLKSLRFDTILCVNVLEHIEQDERALQIFFDLLEPEGKLILLVPAHPILYGKYDVHDGHYRRYSKNCVTNLLEESGFEIRSFRYFNAIGAIGWFVEYRILRRDVHGTGSVKLMSRLAPFLRRIESVVRPLFGISIITVGQKPGFVQ